MNSLFLLFVMTFLHTASADMPNMPRVGPAPAAAADYPTLSPTESDARDAAVVVSVPLLDGYGSGIYMKHHGRAFVLTAAHVVHNSRHVIVTEPSGFQVLGTVIYNNVWEDVACVSIPDLPDRKPIPFRITNKPPKIGTHVTYTGFPNGHSAMTFDGRIAGLENTPDEGPYFLIQSFIWFGSSGSGVFDERGRLVGTVSAVELGHLSGDNVQVIPEIGWIRPIHAVDFKRMLRVIKETSR